MTSGSFADITAFQIKEGKLQITLADQSQVTLDDEAKFEGFIGTEDNPTGILLKNNNLHMEIQIDRNHNIGSEDPAGIKDVLVESAITTIQDCEDSVAAVDGEDKAQVYENWLGLMKGDLAETFQKSILFEISLIFFSLNGFFTRLVFPNEFVNSEIFSDILLFSFSISVNCSFIISYFFWEFDKL